MKINLEDELISEKNLLYWKNQTPCDKNIKDYIDKQFPPNINSILGKNEQGEYIDKIFGELKSKKLKNLSIKWLRPKEIFKNEKYFLFKDIKNINIEDIKQGNIDDCYFISSIIGLLKSDQNMIYKLFKNKDINSNGYYEIIFFIDGVYTIVIIDDYLPVFKDNKELCFGKSTNNEIWLCLLEKAWAKINGGYANIIKGFAHHVLEALTGFPCLNLMHSSYDYNIIWDYIINSFKNKYIITTTSKDNIKDIILERNHSYALVDYYIDNNRKSLKIKDPRGKSLSFNCISLESEKEKENEKGIINISFEDYYKYLSFTNICFTISNFYSKKFTIEGNDIYKGNIFNIYLEEDCILSINVIRKNRIFNREMNKLNLPSFICLVKYNQVKSNINNNINKTIFYDYYSNIQSEENINLNKELKKGYYLFYSYLDYYHSLYNEDKLYYIKFDSNINFKIIKRPCDLKDNGFPILKNIKISGYFNSNKKNNVHNGICYVVKYKNKDLSMKIIYNQNNKWLRITEDCSEIKNIFILTPYQNESKSFDWYIPPKKYDILLGMTIDSSKEGSLNLKSKNVLINSIPINYKNYEINISQYTNDNFI